MTSFKPLQHKPSLLSTPTNSPSSILPPSRLLIPTTPSAPKPVAPLTRLQLEQTAHLGYSFTNIPLVSTVQRKALLPSPFQKENQLRSRIQAARSSGHPLNKQAQQQLEQGLDTDMSRVRIHNDSEANDLSRSIAAVAFTTGNDIFFRSGMYNPYSSQGMHLLVHEATHSVQQAIGPVTGVSSAGNVSLSEPGDPFERAAEESATAITTSSAHSDKIAPNRTGLHSPLNTSITGHPVHKDSGPLPIQRQLEDIGDSKWQEKRSGTIFTATSIQAESIMVEDETEKVYIYNRNTHQYQNFTGEGTYYDPASKRYFNVSLDGSYVATDGSGNYSLSPNGSYVKNPSPVSFQNPQSSPYSNLSQQRTLPSVPSYKPQNYGPFPNTTPKTSYHPYSSQYKPLSLPPQIPQIPYYYSNNMYNTIETPYITPITSTGISIIPPVVQSNVPALSPALRLDLYPKPEDLTPDAPLTSRWTKQGIDMSENTVKHTAKTKGDLAKLIANGHSFAKHTLDIKEYLREFHRNNPNFDREFDYYFDKKRFEDLILYTLCNSNPEGITKDGVGYSYYNAYYRLVVVHNAFAIDGGTAFTRKSGPPEVLTVDEKKTYSLNELLQRQ